MNILFDDAAATPGIDLVTHRDGSRSAILGDDIVVVPANSRRRPNAPVLVAARATASDEHRAIEAAFAAAARLQAPLVAVHCWQEPGALGLPSLNWSPIDWATNREIEREQLSERLAGFRERYPDVEVHRVVRSAPTGSALRPLARTAQLVIVDGIDRSLLRSAAAPVLITPATAEPGTSGARHAYASAMWVCRHVLECQEIG